MAIQWNTGSAQIGALPTADATQEGKIFQYTGETDTNFTNGYFYECVEVTPATDPKTYEWVQKNVQAGGGSGGAEFEITTSSDSASLVQGNDYLGVDLSDANGPTLTLTQPGTYVKSKTLATKKYVDDRDNTFYFRETNTGGVVTYNMTFAELKAMYDAKKQGIFVGSGQNVFPFLTFNYLGPADAGGERIMFKAKVGSNRPEVRVFTVLPDDTVTYETINEGGVNMAVGKETWYGTYTDENDVTYQVYTKTIYIPALPSAAGITNYPIGVSGMKQIISISGVTTDGFVLNAPRQTVTDNITIYQVSKGSQTFSIEVGKDRSNKSAYVTIIYAKNN